MRKLVPVFCAAVTLACPARAEPPADSLVLVEGGSFKHPKSNYHERGITLSSFYVGRHEVTQREWIEVMGANPSQFKGDNLPVEMVTWYDCIEYCNRRSVKEGLQPYYTIDKAAPDPKNQNENDELRWTVTPNEGSNGYRLPTEAEWEYAASGGQLSKGLVYSGADELEKVGWFWQNSGDAPLSGAWNWPAVEKNHSRTRPVGSKQPNELGLHDLSGNVREWCWDWFGDLPSHQTDPRGSDTGTARVWKGGGWVGGDFCCEPSFRASFDPNSMGHDHGFRVARNK